MSGLCVVCCMRGVWCVWYWCARVRVFVCVVVCVFTLCVVLFEFVVSVVCVVCGVFRLYVVCEWRVSSV